MTLSVILCHCKVIIAHYTLGTCGFMMIWSYLWAKIMNCSQTNNKHNMMFFLWPDVIWSYRPKCRSAIKPHRSEKRYGTKKFKGNIGGMSINSVARQKIDTRAQLLLRWLRNVAQFEFSLSSAGCLTLTHSFSAISEKVAINHILSKTRFFGLYFYREQFGS